VALPVSVMALPIERTLRLRMLALGATLLAVAVIAVAALNPYVAKRLNTFTLGFDAAGARPYLVEAGLNMFVDHPVTGVGAGGYQKAFDDDYYSYKDPTIKANVTISHTSVVTIMAELGLIGLAAVAFVTVRWTAYLRDLLGRAPVDLKAVLIGMTMLSAIIFLSSQTEGRFLEDPYLWFAGGIVVAVEAIVRGRPEPDSETAA
jgi:O-antigen ligase